IIDLPAVVPVQLGPDEACLVGGEAGVGQSDLPGPVLGDQARAGAVVEAVRVRDQGAVAAGEGAGAGGGVPAHALAHEAADGPDGKVHGAVVEQGVDGVPGGVGEVAGHAVHGDGDVRGEAGGDAGGGGAAVRCAGDGSAGAGPTEGDGP